MGMISYWLRSIYVKLVREIKEEGSSGCGIGGNVIKAGTNSRETH